MKLCKDCRWYEPQPRFSWLTGMGWHLDRFDPPLCRHPQVSYPRTDPVDGALVRDDVTCAQARKMTARKMPNANCGFEGKLWESRPITGAPGAPL